MTCAPNRPARAPPGYLRSAAGDEEAHGRHQARKFGNHFRCRESSAFREYDPSEA